MISKALFVSTLKRSYKFFLIIAAVLCFYLTVIIYMVDPDDMAQIQEMFAMFEGMMSAFGMDVDAMTDLLSYVASTFFTTLIMAFCMVFYILQGNKLVAKQVADNSLCYTLSMPISRTKFILTEALYLVVAMFALFVLVFLDGIICMNSVSAIDNLAFLNLCALCFLLNAALAMAVFFVSICCCTNPKLSIASAVLPIALLLIYMLGSAGGETFEFLTYISPFGWVDSVGIVNSRVDVWWMYIVFTAIITLFVYLSVVVFKKKRLPL